MSESFRLAGVVVLYNPGEYALSCIEKYVTHLDTLYVVDNSEIIDLNLHKELSDYANVEIVTLGENRGIAYAINLAAYKAIEDGFTWLLQMDQDSFYEQNDIHSLKKHLATARADTAIVAPLISGKRDTLIQEVNEAITSGSALSLQVLCQLGEGLREDYFVYVVDYEYCWRVRANGYTVLECSDILLHHQVGDYIEEVDTDGATVKKNIREVSNLAFYYAFRNTMYLCSEYKRILPDDVKRRKKAFIKTWFMHALHSKKFFEKSRFALTGIRDYYRGKRGQWGY